MAWLGFLSGLIGFYVLSLYQTSFRPPWVAHAVAVGILAVAIAIMVLRRSRAVSALNRLIAGFAFAFFLGIMACITWALAVAEHARSIAGGEPYCIQIGDLVRGD